MNCPICHLHPLGVTVFRTRPRPQVMVGCPAGCGEPVILSYAQSAEVLSVKRSPAQLMLPIGHTSTLWGAAHAN